MAAVNSLLYFLLSSGLTPNVEEPTTPSAWITDSPSNQDSQYFAQSGDQCKRPYEHWDKCSAHCQKNCSNHDKEIICPQVCAPGCVCDEGYVRERDGGKCILEEECQKSGAAPSCPENEHWEICDAHCQKNCSNYKQPFRCELKCKSGCVCDKAYVRERDEGNCIPEEKCPKSGDKCPKHSHYDECKGYPSCQKDCKSDEKGIVCPSICAPGCICDDGYVKGPKGECILKENCPKLQGEAKDECPKYEHFDRCTANCQKNCSNYYKPIICPRICAPGCVCDEGYVRGPSGKCILIKECHKSGAAPSCPENEHWEICDAHCQKNCSNNEKPFPCPLICKSGCVCDKAYVRERDEGNCIPEEKCPKSGGKVYLR
ncbi:zonadhesin [Nephila pilipes]|uniref:Zonadhesin n=1 Tax=Nephila pilipes TaxID=299642 RepID=A0A8X6QVY1_NEPPI|nr:zonadhesin [Nephila pilipes]